MNFIEKIIAIVFITSLLYAQVSIIMLEERMVDLESLLGGDGTTDCTDDVWGSGDTDETRQKGPYG